MSDRRFRKQGSAWSAGSLRPVATLPRVRVETHVPHLILLAPPGGGKSTVIGDLRRLFPDTFDISTGELVDQYLRKNPQESVGREERDNGRLVNDQLVEGLVFNRLDNRRLYGYVPKLYVWNGYPRNEPQAQGFVSMLHRYEDRSSNFKAGRVYVVEFRVDRETVYNRIKDRRICPTCTRTYNLVSLPPQDGIHCDDHPEVAVVKRKDDAAFDERWREYHEKFRPAILQGLAVSSMSLPDIDASRPPSDIARDILERINPYLPK